MPYDPDLADRVEDYLKSKGITFEIKQMMGGIAFLIDGKICVGVESTRLMARIGPDIYEEALRMGGVSEMDFTGRSMRGWVFVDDEVLQLPPMLAEWIDRALAFNPLARVSKKR